MRLLISQEKKPIGRKCEHWTSFLGTRNRLSNDRENPFPEGCALSLLVDSQYQIASFSFFFFVCVKVFMNGMIQIQNKYFYYFFFLFLLHLLNLYKVENHNLTRQSSLFTFY